MSSIIKIYIFICMALFLFNIGFVVIKKLKKDYLYPKNTSMLKYIEKEKIYFQENKRFSTYFKDKVLSSLHQTKKLMLLQKAWQDEPYMMEALRPYLLDCIDVYSQKNEDERAFYAYMLSLLPYNPQRPSAAFSLKLIEFLESRSIYTFANTMLAIYQFGDPYLMLQGIDKCNKRGEFYHKKLFVDGMLTYSGDCKVLHELIYKQWGEYTAYTQECLIDYFRIKGEDIGEFCLKELEAEQLDEQVKYAIMRYLAKYPSAEARDRCLTLLADDTTVWIEQMLAIQVLGNYTDQTVKEAIEAKVTSKHWYVRWHAISYLRGIDVDKTTIYRVLCLRDRYTDEALLYHYKDNEEMIQYIEEVIQSLDEVDGLDKSYVSA